MNKSLKNARGITLVALVVTIVVLLILASITISEMFNDKGLWDKSNEFMESANTTIEKNSKQIDNMINELDTQINSGGQNETTGGDTTGEDDTSILPSTSSTIPYYPDDTFTKVVGTDLTSGLVIKDSDGNEYVWIEVPKTATVYSTAGLEITTFTDDEYTAIETDLHTYTNYYRNGTSYTDTYYSDKVTGLTSDQYTELKQKMLKSVYQNGGFWIGRYEAGRMEARTTSGTAVIAPLSKAGTVENAVYPYTYVTCSQAQILASKLSTENYTSSLMFGVQWDLVLKHIEVKEVEQGTELATIQSALKTNSKDWGNYYSTSFEINRGKYAKDKVLTTWYDYNTASEGYVTYEDGKSTKASSGEVLLTTGASDTRKKMNIYDLAGNVFEWTLEYTNSGGSPCTYRGGHYITTGSYFPVFHRSSTSATSGSTTNGFRVSIYK